MPKNYTPTVGFTGNCQLQQDSERSEQVGRTDSLKRPRKRKLRLIIISQEPTAKLGHVTSHGARTWTKPQRHWKGSWKVLSRVHHNMSKPTPSHGRSVVDRNDQNNRYTCTWIIIYLSNLMVKSQSQASRDGARTSDLCESLQTWKGQVNRRQIHNRAGAYGAWSSPVTQIGDCSLQEQKQYP